MKYFFNFILIFFTQQKCFRLNFGQPHKRGGKIRRFKKINKRPSYNDDSIPFCYSLTIILSIND